MGRDRTGEVLAALKQSHAADRLHHAYIFTGPAGTGKWEAVEKFASALFSEGSGLFGGGDETAMLERIRRSGHPDFLWIRKAEDESQIAVEQVRELHKALSYAPLEAPRRIVAIEDAHAMNATTANAILKVLEEPPSHTLFFLTCPDVDLLLPTIRSRCQVIRFFPLSSDSLKVSLQKEFPATDTALLDCAVARAEGSLLRAKQYLEEEELRALDSQAKEALLSSWEAAPRIPMASLKFLENLDDDEKTEAALFAWESLIRDSVVLLQGGDLPLYENRLRPRLQNFLNTAKGWTSGKLSECAFLQEFVEKSSAIHRMRVQRSFHVNRKAALDNLLCELQIFSIGKIRQTK